MKELKEESNKLLRL